MADHFGAIAAQEIGKTREPLVFPEPIKKNGVLFPLSAADGKPAEVYKKLSTKAELDEFIATLGEKYAPFLEKHSPELKNSRKKQELTRFDFRPAKEGDMKNFASVLSGAGKWEEVNIPHFGAPIGDAVTFYKTAFALGETGVDECVFVHFQCADYIAEVYVNGALAGTHEGFFGSFEFDITPYVSRGENTLFVLLKNDYRFGGEGGRDNESVRLEGEKLYAATGMGFDDSVRGWHHCPAGMGLCGKVYIEARPRTFISDIFVRPMPDTSEIEVWCEVYRCNYAPEGEFTLSYSVCGENFEGTLVDGFTYKPFTYHHESRGDIMTQADAEHPKSDEDSGPRALKLMHAENLFKLRLRAPDFRRWTPDEPFLYNCRVTLSVGGNEIDSKDTVFGMRTFKIDTESTPKGMFFLNGESIRLRGANTMGYEQQDVLRGDSKQLLYDMLMAKACNMNFLRLTQRPVQDEIYSLCDRIGLMIQTDFPLFTVIRRTKFAEGIRQCEEMEKLIRNHPSCVLISYMNEPMANADNRPHRHLVRAEQDMFFSACDNAVTMLNPDRAIKHIDGDYDPPDTCLPDNHCYCCWYNGHGIDAGQLYRGYWLGIKDGWYCGCGEFGSEGLDPAPLMRRRYPAEWLPKTPEEEKTWSPSKIKDSQSGNMHYFFYDTQDSLEDWVRESHAWQVKGTKLQTEAFRRNPLMVTFAIHLFIDAWPSGWMKTIVDCERNPKPAFFAYRDALSPVLTNIRTDRKTYFSGESVTAEAYICNDTHISSDGHKIRFELINSRGLLCAENTSPAVFGENDVFIQGEVAFTAPDTDSREKYVLRMILTDKNGNVIHYCDEPLEFFAPLIKSGKTVLSAVGYDDYKSRESELLTAAENGETVLISGLLPGKYEIAGKPLSVKACGMRALHFVSRKTGHPLVSGFEPYDFSFWYERGRDMMTPLIRRTFLCDGAVPVLTSGNCLTGSAWGNPLFPALAVGEIKYGKGKIIVSELELENHLENPVAAIFKERLNNY